jgi:hypothetical protein
MVYYWLLFFFVAFGAKLLLAGAMIYLLLPRDAECSECGEATLLLRASVPGRIGYALAFGRVQRRWCPRCGWEGLARSRHGVRGQSRETAATCPQLEKL